ncbi:MAG: septation protein A [Alphaproteobacteria bacterium]|nr:septation protein A [Alphaproteobacteria bacterium]
MTPRLNAAIEYGPLAVFLAAYFIGNRYLDDIGAILAATAAIMVATVVALSVAWFVQHRVPKVPLISGGLLMVFGGLTLWLQDPVFIKMKPTIVYLLFSTVLVGGVAMRRPLLKPLLGNAWQLDDTGWTKLTIRFGLFFMAMAGLNELVWRTQTTDFWVSYKVFGTMGLILVFTMTQIGLIHRHQIQPESEGPDKAD